MKIELCRALVVRNTLYHFMEANYGRILDIVKNYWINLKDLKKFYEFLK